MIVSPLMNSSADVLIQCQMASRTAIQSAKASHAASRVPSAENLISLDGDAETLVESQRAQRGVTRLDQPVSDAGGNFSAGERLVDHKKAIDGLADIGSDNCWHSLEPCFDDQNFFSWTKALPRWTKRLTRKSKILFAKSLRTV